jgi:hypothetical protein
MSNDQDGEENELQARVAAVEEFLQVADRLFQIGEIKWTAVVDDYRLLAINASIRRQLEAIRAGVVLVHQDLGHLAVAFVRASIEEVMYLKFFQGLNKEASQRLFTLLGSWDGLRSLLAQRAYVGESVMHELWFSTEFLDAAEDKRDQVRVELRALRKEYKWSGGDLPSAQWIAERVGEQRLYAYLHAATSRALHFSAGEIARRGWGNPSGTMMTDKPGFREHLAAFALYQLVVLFFETWAGLEETGEASVTLNPDVDASEVDAVVQQIAALGLVPLVHAAEWNLSPDGPLPLREPSDD